MRKRVFLFLFLLIKFEERRGIDEKEYYTQSLRLYKKILRKKKWRNK
jgi:hypothetical protein